jgi:hypothetical protein
VSVRARQAAGAAIAPLRRFTQPTRDFLPPPERSGVLIDGDDPRLPVVLAEYAAVRHEIQTALANQQSSLSVGTAALGLLATVGAHFWPNDAVLAGLVFVFAVPAACAVAVRMWYGELLRIARGARFVAQLEDWIRPRGCPTLSWERWMAQCRTMPGQDIDTTNWRAVIAGFGALAAMSVALGLDFLYRAEGLLLALPAAAVVVLLFVNVRHQVLQLESRAELYLAQPQPALGASPGRPAGHPTGSHRGRERSRIPRRPSA